MAAAAAVTAVVIAVVLGNRVDRYLSEILHLADASSHCLRLEVRIVVVLFFSLDGEVLGPVLHILPL